MSSTGVYAIYLSIQVLMKDIMTPVPVDEVRAVIKKCLENSALINYNKLASEAKVEGQYVWHCSSFRIDFHAYYGLLAPCCSSQRDGDDHSR